MIKIKSLHEVQKMRTAGRIVAEVFEVIKPLIVPGITTRELDKIAAEVAVLKEKGVENVSLLVSHCEQNIFKGQVFDYIDRVYTTDSILDFDNMDVNADTEIRNKIEFIKKYREVKE